jgi:hypothetical protein
MNKIFKSSILLTIILLLIFTLVGCGNGNKAKDVNNNEEEYSDENKNQDYTESDSYDEKFNGEVKNLSESINKYLEVKSLKMDEITAKTENSYELIFPLINFSAIDLQLIPATFCGLEEESVDIGLNLLLKDVNYTVTGNNSYSITYKTEVDNETQLVRFEAEYDSATDSGRIKSYTNDVLDYTMEYIKTNKGYASQYMVKNSDSTKLYKNLFDEKNITISSIEGTISDSIYKGNNNISENWLDTTDTFIQIKDGVFKAFVNGAEVDLNKPLELE